jgi:hypothetical protein
MYVSHETPTEMQARLLRVVREANLVVYEGSFAFVEVPVQRFPVNLAEKALALVRDEIVWSALVPSDSPGQEQFLVFRFHFTPGIDNSGFVGWLASYLKERVGTGVLVVCGQNSGRGGIFDYWGVPMSVSRQVLSELKALRGG